MLDDRVAPEGPQLVILKADAIDAQIMLLTKEGLDSRVVNTVEGVFIDQFGKAKVFLINDTDAFR